MSTYSKEESERYINEYLSSGKIEVENSFSHPDDGRWRTRVVEALVNASQTSMGRENISNVIAKSGKLVISEMVNPDKKDLGTAYVLYDGIIKLS